MTDKPYPSARDCEHGRKRGSCDVCDYEQEISKLKTALHQCHQTACYSVGASEALSRQLAVIRQISSEALTNN